MGEINPLIMILTIGDCQNHVLILIMGHEDDRTSPVWTLVRSSSLGYLCSCALSHHLPHKMSIPKYPPDREQCMNRVPDEPGFVVADGHLIYMPNRDARFPYIYAVDKHPLNPHPEITKKILVYIIKNTDEFQKQSLKWENSLEVPLGPDARMKEYGA